MPYRPRALEKPLLAATLIECKAGRTVTPAMATSLQRLAQAFASRGVATKSLLVHERSGSGPSITAVAPGVRAVDWRELEA